MIDLIGLLGIPAYTIFSLLLASTLASVIAFFELTVLRRQRLARHTMAFGIVFPLSVSLLGVFVAARALSRWLASEAPMDGPEPLYSLIAFIRLTALLGLIVASLGAGVHIAAARAINRYAPASASPAFFPNDRNA